ncbi:hypothetical protein L228DRAFT_245187 [Xylona heveae TC161]|uniref:DUF7732 domain-containing protein n=1 Tax=Xylona heveae (strain CBS 132557 / TC161) TaxID=1328760 RepID=A0A165I2K3_XYLHT|nr:hypothetical protein L228DRAFT_245187 [Xylona heveae TC161]KZF24279.1 hypothetical protein L228DRAFT_245187 [Xylona heveae TC161]
MKILLTAALLLACACLLDALSIPGRDVSVFRRGAEALGELIDPSSPTLKDLEKRRGGGGGGGRGGGGSGGKSGGKSSGSGGGSKSGGSKSSGSTSSGSKSGGSKSGGSSSSSRSSNAGGQTKSGSGPRPAYGGYYGGGAAVPYSAGRRSPLGIAPFLLPVGALAFFPGLWLYGAYAYPYGHPYTFHNSSATNATNPNGVNQTLPVECFCQQYSVCGCDSNNNTAYIQSLLGNGSESSMNSSLVHVAEVNGTQTILINGTLPNGTTAAGSTSGAGGMQQMLLQQAGYWVIAVMVGGAVWLI